MGFVGPKLIKLWTSSIWGFLELPLWWTLWLCKHAGHHSVTTGACSPPHLTCLGLCSMAAWKLNEPICAMPASQRAFGKLHQQCNFFRPPQNYRHFPDDMIKCIFLNTNIWISILKFIPEGPIESFTRWMSLQTTASQRTSGWRGSIEITWRGLVAMPSTPIQCKCLDGWFVLKSITHGSKCLIELCLPIDVVWKFSWLMKTCSEFRLHLPDAANKVTQIVHVYMWTSGMGFVKTININFTDNLPTFPITKSLWSYLKLLLICLLELDFGFDQSLPRGQPVGKSPYYRSFDRSANWRVKDSINNTPGSNDGLAPFQRQASVWIFNDAYKRYSTWMS